MRTTVVLPLRAIFALTLALVYSSVPAAGDGSRHWVATWITANAASDRPVTFSNQTIREVVHTTIGGKAIRLRLSNTFGPRAIRFDAVYAGLQQEG
ncbi:MAG: hypothetical protein ABSC41_21470, partial [Acidimicrobiales bacterium]